MTTTNDTPEVQTPLLDKLLIIRGMIAGTVRETERLLGINESFPASIHLLKAYSEIEAMLSPFNLTDEEMGGVE